MSSYRKPSSSSYSLERYEKAQYLANRQPLPRSNYQREFLYYGVVPTYSSKIENPNPAASTSISMKGRISNYQSEFKGKRTNLVDSKTLDCRRDKFRYILAHSETLISVSCLANILVSTRNSTGKCSRRTGRWTERQLPVADPRLPRPRRRPSTRSTKRICSRQSSS